MKWLLAYIRSNRFTVFAIYRIILGFLLLGLIALGSVPQRGDRSAVVSSAVAPADTALRPALVK